MTAMVVRPDFRVGLVTNRQRAGDSCSVWFSRAVARPYAVPTLTALPPFAETRSARRVRSSGITSSTDRRVAASMSETFRSRSTYRSQTNATPAPNARPVSRLTPRTTIREVAVYAGSRHHTASRTPTTVSATIAAIGAAWARNGPFAAASSHLARSNMSVPPGIFVIAWLDPRLDHSPAWRSVPQRLQDH